MVIGPVLLGLIAENWGLRYGFFVTGGIGLVGVVLTEYYFRTHIRT
jgi:MFS family permease